MNHDDVIDAAGLDADPVGDPVRHTWNGDRRPSTSIAEAVAAVTDRDPVELPPLQRFVDADAMDRLLTGNGDGLCLLFTYSGTVVAVDSAGEIAVWVDGERSE